MKTVHTTVFRKSMISLATLALCSIPLMVSANSAAAHAPDAAQFRTELSTEISNDPEAVYDRLRTESHKVCGSSSLLMTGDLIRSRKVEECYEGTLTAAVHRLDDPAVTELHSQ